MLLLVSTFAQDPGQKWTDHQWGICIFDDLIEYTGPHCKKYKDYFLSPLANYLNDKQPEVRQAACYGFGVLGLCGGEEFARKYIYLSLCYKRRQSKYYLCGI